MQNRQNNTKHPTTVAELKKMLTPSLNENEHWICASCPLAQFETVAKSGEEEQNTQIIAIMTPLKEIGYRYASCYCTLKGRYMPGYITVCQGYENAILEAQALDQTRTQA